MTTSPFDPDRDPFDEAGSTSLSGREEESWRLDETDVEDEDEDDDAAETWGSDDASSL